MDNKEAIAVLKSNYPHGKIMLSEAVDLSIKTLEAAELQTTAHNSDYVQCFCVWIQDDSGAWDILENHKCPIHGHST